MSDNVAILSRESQTNKRWGTGQGFKPWSQKKELNGKEKDIPWKLDQPYLGASGTWQSDLLMLPQDTITLGKALKEKKNRCEYIYCNPDPRFFVPPMVLVSQGFASPKVTYNDNMPVVFQHALQSICILKPARDDEKLLKFLCAYVRSSLGKYFLFHNSSNWGTERDKVHLYELLRIPFPLPADTDDEKRAQNIIDEVNSLFSDLSNAINTFEDKDLFVSKDRIKTSYRKRLVEECQLKLNQLIYKYFDLTTQEIAIVEDTNQIIIPSTTPTTWDKKVPSLDCLASTHIEPYHNGGLKIYADMLCSVLNNWSAQGNHFGRISARYDYKEQGGLISVCVFKQDIPFPVEQLSNRWLSNSKFISDREVIHFSDYSVTITRPDKLICWTRIAAINDAARLFSELRALWGGG